MQDKLENTGLKGYVKATLMKDGEVVQEVEKSNFVTKYGKELMRINQARGVGFGAGIGSGEYGTYPIDIFARLLLSDSTQVENPTEDVYLWGNALGSKLRGYINSSESFTNHERTHLVFDFLTTEANGTIGSIGFVGGGEDVSSYTFNMGNVVGTNMNSYIPYQITDDIFYYYNKANNTEYIAFDMRTKTTTTKNFTKRIDMVVKLNGVAYGLVDTMGSDSLFRMNEDLTDVTSEKFTFDKLVPNIHYMQEIEGKIYMVSSNSSIDSYNNNRYSSNLYIFSLEGMLLEVVKVDKSTHYTVAYTGDGCLSLGGHPESYLYNIRTGELKQSSRSLLPTYPIMWKGDMYCISNIVTKVIPSTLATKIVLPEPIIKTSEHTLKIEYDFTY